MRGVELEALIRATPPERVFDAVLRFDRYPALAPHVRSTTVHATVPEPVGRSSWALHFRSGLLRWTEEEHFHRDALRLEFAQVSGDFEEFGGCWTFTADGADTRLHFRADFDFGIPSLEGILDPIAERVIKETVAWAVAGLFDGVRLEDHFELVPSPGHVRPGL